MMLGKVGVTTTAPLMLVAAFSFGPSAIARPAQGVTLTVLRTFDQPTRSYKLRFSGICGYSYATAVAGTQTARIPAKSAAPCFKANATDKVVSS